MLPWDTSLSPLVVLRAGEKDGGYDDDFVEDEEYDSEWDEEDEEDYDQYEVYEQEFEEDYDIPWRRRRREWD